MVALLGPGQAVVYPRAIGWPLDTVKTSQMTQTAHVRSNTSPGPSSEVLHSQRQPTMRMTPNIRVTPDPAHLQALVLPTWVCQTLASQ